MAQNNNFTPFDQYAADRREAERLDRRCTRLEASLIDTSSASDRLSATQPAPTVEHPESPSFWRAIKRRSK